MDTIEPSLKKLSKIALVAMGALFILGAIFYKERALFSDGAYSIFHLINSGRIDVPGGNRYGAFVVQILPYLAQRLHSSVNTILFFYGASYNLFYFLAIFIVYRYRQYSLVILMALYYFLFVSESYIWVSETFQGTAWMFLFFAVTLHQGHKRVNIFLLLVPFVLLGFLAIFSHFVVLIPMTFLWVYLIIEKKNWPFSKNVSLLLSSILIVMLGLKLVATNSSYDNQHLHGIMHFSIKDILLTFQKPVVKIFLYRCMVNYWLGTLVFIIGIITLVKSNEKILAIWTFISVLGYIIIMGLTYESLDETTLLFHIESEWSFLAIIVAAPFVFISLPKLKSQTIAWLLIGIFVIRSAYIISSLQSFTIRNNQTEQILAQMRKKGITKLALYNDQHLMEIAKLGWGLPFESILRSSIDGDKPQLTFLFVNPDDKKTMEELNNTKGFYHAWMMLSYKDLNKEYFNIDTTKPYQIMTYAEFLK